MMLPLLFVLASSESSYPRVWVAQGAEKPSVVKVSFGKGLEIYGELPTVPHAVSATGNTWQFKYVDVEKGGRGRLIVSAANGKVTFRTAVTPEPYDIGTLKDTLQIRSSEFDALGGSRWLPKEQRFSSTILVWDSSGKWHSFPNASMWVSGRNTSELFLGQFDGDLSKSDTKLVRGWVVNRKTGKATTVSPRAFRDLLWPAARVAFDKWGAGPFFLNPVARPGYPTDPAYVISKLEPYTDSEDVAAGKSAIVFPNGKIITKSYHWNPLIATTMRGKTMYVLTDDSYYNAMGWNEREVLHLMKVDSKEGLVRVASVEDATGVSYAFANEP